MLNDLIQLADDSSDPNLIGAQMVLAASWGWAFLFALARFIGLLVLSPLFGQRGVSIWLRIGLAICLAAVVAPLLLKPGLMVIPSDAWDGGLRLGMEFIIGALLGIGVLCVFAGLKLAGELIDQQAGVAVQEVFDPSGSGTSTSSGQLLTIVGTLSLLCVTPGNGHLRILATLIDSFQSTPGSAMVSGEGAVLWISHLGTQSLSLALQVAAPVLAAGVIIAWGGMALSGGTGSSAVSSTVLGVPLRVVLSLFILAAGLTGATDVFLIQVEELLQAFPRVFQQA